MEFIEEGYEQLSEYVNARTKVKMKCPEGHVFEILPNNWKKGSRCGKCYRDKLKNDGVVNRKESELQQNQNNINGDKEELIKFISEINEQEDFQVVRSYDTNSVINYEIYHLPSEQVINLHVYKGVGEVLGIMPIYMGSSSFNESIEWTKKLIDEMGDIE